MTLNQYDILNVNEAIKLAKTSEYHQFKIGCVIVDKRSRIISKGVNSLTKTHPEQARLAIKCNEPHKIFLHAEIQALVKCREVPHTLYVARVARTGALSTAKPCPICMEAIRQAGVKKIVFTTSDGTVNIEKI